ncbi:ABC transporter substrate-binding protein [Spirillospora sp. NPDC047279]|uniref:ABC transporter substrate-binding protein n=1 Tax=Spirillospora sp. NPDC047279 TaxID=3155478 RepID=UPI0034119D1D
MAGEGDRVLSEDRLRGVLDLFERLRERPTRRWRERVRPLLLLLGTGGHTGHVVDLFKNRCEAERAPVSHIAATTTATDVAGVLREAGRELSQPSSHPRGEPPLRFPLLEMALWLRDLREIRLAGDRPVPRDAPHSERENHLLVQRLTRPPIGDNEDSRRRELNRVIRRRGRDVLRDLEEGQRGRPATFLGFLEQIAPIGVAAVAVISAGTAAALDLVAAAFAAALGLAFVLIQILARTRGWYGVRRYRWFLRQPYLDSDSTGFLGFALRVVDPRPVEPDDHGEQLDLLLVAAFLEDLRRNHRRNIRRAAWARVRYPVLLFEHLPPGHVGVEFVELVERVRADNQRDPRLRDFDPLVIIAGVDPLAPATDDPSMPSDSRLVDRLTRSARAAWTGDAADAVGARRLWDDYWREQRRVRALGSRRALRVDVTRDPGGDLPPPRAPRRRPRAAHPALPWIAMVAVLVSSVTVVAVQAVKYCSPFQIRRTAEGECIGITDGSFQFGESSAGENNDNRLSPVLSRIKELNDEVLLSGKPYVTVVYLGPVTADASIKNRRIDLLAGAQGELVGLAIAQQRFNDASQNLRLRVLVANAGAKFRYAVQVAEQIRERALDDRSIVAVVGFEQSRRQTQDAIKVLAKSALPLVGTANSYNRTAMLNGGAGFSPYYFRLAPPNSRLARHAAFWAREGQVGGIRARSVDVIYNADPQDLYSKDLADEFEKSFRPGKVRRWPYANPGDLDEAVRTACKDPADLFYYAGRSDEFRGFINVLELACSERRVVLADDEIAKYVSDNGTDIGRKGTFELYFTPLALGEAWTPRWIGARQAPQTFYSDYDPAVEKMFGADVPRNEKPSITRAAVSYDAATVIANVANQVYWEQDAQPTAGSVFAALNDPERDVLPNGASGVLRFGPRSTGHQVVDKPVLLATVRRDGRTEVVALCGKLVAGGQAASPCPPEPRR